MSVSFLDENGTLIQPYHNRYDRGNNMEVMKELKTLMMENNKFQSMSTPSRGGCKCGGCSCGSNRNRSNESLHPALMVALILACILMLKKIIEK